jgi:hypothetical protein
MSITKWKTGSSASSVIPMEIIRETDSSVWFEETRWGKTKEVRVNKRGVYDNYFDTWSEARDFLQMKADAKVALLRRQLEDANSKAGNIRGLKEPEPKP